MKMPIPNDWDGSTFCNYLVNWPQSTLWRIILRGLLSNPSLIDFWDAATGDIDQTIEDFRPALDQNLDELECTNMNIPVGTIWLFAGDVAPDGWLLCDGTEYLETDYPDLFSAIGRLYGGSSGEGTFWLPNLKGKVPVGFDSSQSEFDFLGNSGGEKTHTLITGEMPAHNHDIRWATNAGGSSTQYAPGGTFGGNHATIIQSQGGGQAHNNLQPYLVLNYMIRVQ